MCTSVGTAMRKATDALLDADLSWLKRVILRTCASDDLRNHARRSPSRCSPAGAGSDHLARGGGHHPCRGDLERMGDLALHVPARPGGDTRPAVLPEEIKGTLARDGQVACELAHQRRPTLSGRPTFPAQELIRRRRDDDLPRHMFTVLMGRGSGRRRRGRGDVTLPGRFYERYRRPRGRVAAGWSNVITGQIPSSASAPTPSGARSLRGGTSAERPAEDGGGGHLAGDHVDHPAGHATAWSP